MERIGAIKARAVGAARPDVLRIRRAVEFDECVGVGQLLLVHHGAEVGQRILLGPHQARHVLGVVKGDDGVVERALGPQINLFEVRVAIRAQDDVRIEIEGNGRGRQPQGRVPGLGVVHRGLQAGGDRRQFLQLGHGGAVDLLDAARVRGIGVHIREDGVADHPVQIRALPGARGPMIHAPIAGAGDGAVREVGLGRGEVRPPVPRTGEVIATPGEIEGLLASSCHRARGGGELPFVLVIHRHWLAQDRHGFDARHPVKILIHEQGVVAFQRGEIMAVGIAVALRIELPRVVGVHHAIAVLIEHIVVERIDHLASVDAAGVVPDQAIVNRAQLDAREQKVIAPAHQRQFLLEDGGQLPLEREEGRGDGAVGVMRRANADGRIRGVGPSLVAQDHVEIVQVAGGEQQRVVGRAVVDAAYDAEVFTAVEDGFINLDQARAVEVVEIQRHVAFPAPPGLGHDADIRVDGVVEEIGDPLVEGVDALERALDPALGQLRRSPLRPDHVAAAGARHVGGVRGVLRLITHDQIIVRKTADIRAAAEDGAHPVGIACRVQGQPVLSGEIGGGEGFQPRVEGNELCGERSRNQFDGDGVGAGSVRIQGSPREVRRAERIDAVQGNQSRGRSGHGGVVLARVRFDD